MINSGADDSLGTVLLTAADAGARGQVAGFLRQFGYTLIPDSDAGAGVPDIVVVVSDGSTLPPAPAAAMRGEYPPPMVVLGPVSGGEWRKQALQQGAFACLSFDAPVEERASLLSAASRFREMQLQVETIRRESNEIITGLLTTYGEEAQQRIGAVEERKEAQAHLDRIQRRIIRSIL